MPVLLIAIGTIAFRAVEGVAWFDALYLSTATLTAIGSDRSLLSTEGRALTIVLALGGIFTFALAATEVLRTVITGELRDYWEKRGMARRIERLEQHVIVCGYGRVGRYACAHLVSAGVPFVVVDRREAPLAAALAAGGCPVLGDATTEGTLRRAGIARARAVVAAVGSDAENVLIVLTARLLCPEVPIVARAAEEDAVPKLRGAGATNTVSPHALGGGRMIELVLDGKGRNVTASG